MGFFHTVRSTRKAIRNKIHNFDDYSKYWSAKQNITKVKNPKKRKYLRSVIKNYQREMLKGVEILRPASDKNMPGRS